MRPAGNDYPPSYSSYYDDESFANKRSIRQYINIVYKRLPIILAIAVIVTAAVSFYSFRQPSIYQASTELIIEPRKPQVTQKEAININFGNDSNYYNTQLQLLQNADLMKKVVVALGKTAASLLLATDASVAGLRGRVHRYRDVPLVVTYHPAYLLRSLSDKAKTWEDLVLARATIERSGGEVSS